MTQLKISICVIYVTDVTHQPGAQIVPCSSFDYGPVRTTPETEVSSGALRERRAAAAISVNQP